MARERCVLCGHPADESSKLKNITFRGVPRDPSTRFKWQEFCYNVYKLPRTAISLNSTRVCSLHFTEDCFYIRNGLVHTKPYSVPTLYVEPVIQRKEIKRRNKKNILIGTSDSCKKPLVDLQSTSMDIMSFSPISDKCVECEKNEECHLNDKINNSCPKKFDQIEKQVQLTTNMDESIMKLSNTSYQLKKNDGDSKHSSPQLYEPHLPVEVYNVEQLCTSNGECPVFSNLDEKNQELSRQIKIKSESLIHFIESLTKSTTSYQSNKNCTNNNVAVTVYKPKQREIPLYHVVGYMKRARANKKRKKNLELSYQIKEKSELLTNYIESALSSSTFSNQSTESIGQNRTKNPFKLERNNFNVIRYGTSYETIFRLKHEDNDEVKPSEYYGKKNICIVAPIKSDSWQQNYKHNED